MDTLNLLAAKAFYEEYQGTIQVVALVLGLGLIALWWFMRQAQKRK